MIFVSYSDPLTGGKLTPPPYTLNAARTAAVPQVSSTDTVVVVPVYRYTNINLCPLSTRLFALPSDRTQCSFRVGLQQCKTAMTSFRKHEHEHQT